MRTISLVGLLALTSVVGCGLNRHTDPLPGVVLGQETPPTGAVPPRGLVVVRPASGLGESRAPVWIGLADAQGAIHPTLEHPGPFDVTVHVPGYRSPASMADPFAASATLTDVSADGLLDLGVALAASPTPADAPGLPGRVLEDLGETFPEGVRVGAERLGGVRDLGLAVTCASPITVTLLHHDADLIGALGWFRWEPGAEGVPLIVETGTAIAEGASLERGSTWSLAAGDGSARSFTPGERIGLYFARATGGATVVPSSSAAENGATAGGVLLTVDALNPEIATEPERAAHFVALPYAAEAGVLGGGVYAVLGLEQGARDLGADDDFNDLVFAVSADVPACLDLSALGASLGPRDDADEDGVLGLADAFPTDAARAFVIDGPAAGRQSVAFEDTYPARGDDDFNDAVVRYSLREVRSASGEIRDLEGTFHLVARGAGLDHAFYLAYPGLPAGVTGDVAIERFTSAGVESLDAPAWDALVVTSPNGARLLRVPVFPSTKDMLPIANTTDPVPTALPASARFVVHLATGVASDVGFGSISHDPALGVKRGGEIWDVHLPGHDGFADRPAQLPTEEGDGAFIDAHGPWAVRLLADFRYPLEKIAIPDAFPDYVAWLASSGVVKRDWFLRPVEGRVVVRPVADFHRRIWAISASVP